MIGYEGTNMEFADKSVAFVQWIISIVKINKNARLVFLFTEEREKKIMREERDACFHTMAIDCTNAAVVGPAVVICVGPLYDKYVDGIYEVMYTQ